MRDMSGVTCLSDRGMHQGPAWSGPGGHPHALSWGNSGVWWRDTCNIWAELRETSKACKLWCWCSRGSTPGSERARGGSGSQNMESPAATAMEEGCLQTLLPSSGELSRRVAHARRKWEWGSKHPTITLLQPDLLAENRTGPAQLEARGWGSPWTRPSQSQGTRRRRVVLEVSTRVACSGCPDLPWLIHSWKWGLYWLQWIQQIQNRWKVHSRWSWFNSKMSEQESLILLAFL